ncbi:MAG TPA: SMI1/KNR4 family protein [Pirellulaceae bacterium]|nr:SMI1/KNR4 family protein [Pirellulaceae bacterium]
MFDKFKPFIGTEDAPNLFLPVSIDEIESAERRLGYEFPSELRAFYCEVGYGFWSQGVQDAEADRYVINRVIPPYEVAELVCNQENELRPHGGLAEGELPFFDLGERDYFVIKSHSDNPNRVWFYDTVLTESVVEFFDRLYERARFYP